MPLLEEVALRLSETARGSKSRTSGSSLSWANLFAWRQDTGFGTLEAVALSLFAAIGACAVHFHEMWDDEAQAWLVVRDSTLWQLIHRRLHYEGAPPLWHFILSLYQAVHGSYPGMDWLGLGFAVAGVYVLLRWSPFPPIVRFLLPFTFFLQYQYAVVARGYVIFPLLTFTLCALYWRKEKIVWFALAAGLLADLSVHGFVVAVTLGFLYMLDFRKSGREAYRLRSASFRKRRNAGLAAFALMGTFAVYCTIPAPDHQVVVVSQFPTGPIHEILLALVGETPRNMPRPPADPPIPGPMEPPQPSWRTSPRAWIAWEINHAPQPGWAHYAAHEALNYAGPPMLEGIGEATWPIANSNLLACAFLAATALWLRRRRSLRFLLPAVGIIGIGFVLWNVEHHAGMIFLAIVAGVWIAAESPAPIESRPRLEAGFLALFAAVLIGQIAWSAVSIRAEVYGSYDPGTETAKWLQQYPNARVAGFGFWTTSMQPWFPHNRFFNEPAAYWAWSSNVEIDNAHRATIATHPDIVIYSQEFQGYGRIRDQWLPQTVISPELERTLPYDPIIADLRAHGYHETHRFWGTRFARFSSAYRTCDIVFEPFEP
jgi:hypothetical protein